MITVVNYKYEDNEAVKRLINKMSETKFGIFVDIGNIISRNRIFPTLEFAALQKTLLEETIKNKNIIVDGRDLESIFHNLDFFQKDFILKTIDSFGRIDICVGNVDYNISNNDTIVYMNENDFYIDFEKKYIEKVKWFDVNSVQNIIKIVSAEGFYLGSCKININNASSSVSKFKLVKFSGNPGQPISYDEYIKWILSNWDFKKIQEKGYAEMNLDKFIFVRQHHPIEFLLKKYFNN